MNLIIPEWQEKIPKLSESEYKGLKENIKNYGIKHNVEVYDKK